MGRGAVTRRASTLAAAGRAWRTWGRRVPTRTPGPPPRRAHQPGHRLRPAARALSPDRRGDLRLAVSARSRRVHGWDRREPLWPRRGPHGIMTARGWGTRTRWAGRDRATGEVRDLVRARPDGPRGGNISYSGTLVKPRTSKSRASWTPPRRIRPGRPRHSGQPAPIGALGVPAHLWVAAHPSREVFTQPHSAVLTGHVGGVFRGARSPAVAGSREGDRRHRTVSVAAPTRGLGTRRGLSCHHDLGNAVRVSRTINSLTGGFEGRQDVVGCLDPQIGSRIRASRRPPRA
jgi:hypothetical protein